jgi:hypothetical protein
MYISPLATEQLMRWVSSLFGFVLTGVFRFMHRSPENRGHMLTTKIAHFVKLSKCGMDFTIAFLSSRRSKTYIERLIRSPDEGIMPPARHFVVRTSDYQKF